MRTRWLGPGLFLATLSTLLLETLDARLLSVLTWYHLSFFAVSVAMLGMAAGAVFVFLTPTRFSTERTPATLAATAFAFACSIPASHLLTLLMPFLPMTEVSTMAALSIGTFTIALGVPFTLSGIVVTTALTRCGGSINRLYAYDLIGAAVGCLLVVPLLEWTNISSAVLVAGAAAAGAAFCFSRMAGGPGTLRALAAVGALLIVACVNTGEWEGISVLYPKNRQLWLTSSSNAIARWNSHSYVVVHRPGDSQAFLWGPGRGAEQFRTRIAWLAIDGEAGTPLTQWDGDRSSLEWVAYDVTTLPYYLRQGDVAVIGVGGGRDILAALWGGNRSVLGVDVNRIMIDLLEGSHRAFTNIANQPQVTLVHDDGRAQLTRTTRRFDVIQMSLVDTWASTGAGAFSLSENGLYTLDAWRMFLSRLTPTGVLSVSRWFDPSNVSETSRLLSLGVAALIDRGVSNPHDHVMLVIRDRVATLMISPAAFTAADRGRVDVVAREKGFDVLVAPWVAGRLSLLDRIGAATSPVTLAAATSDPVYDFTPPTDARPYYFNMLKPAAFFNRVKVPATGILAGNLRATMMLLILLGVAAVLVLGIIVWPLWSAGRPAMAIGRFGWTMAYFGIIGCGYMLIQIALLQRFSTYIGHPTYTLAIVLCSMLLFTGLGSLAAGPVLGRRSGTALALLPLLIAATLIATALALPKVVASTVADGLVARSLWVLVFTGSLSVLLGMCFPIGVRLVSDRQEVVAWAWGVNGALGVLASIVAVGLSIWVSIDTNFWVAAMLYAALVVPLRGMKPANNH